MNYSVDAYHAMQDRACKLEDENAALRLALAKAEAERDEAREWVRRMHGANTTTCVWCGTAFPPGTPGAGAEVLLEHAKSCAKHPLNAAIARAQRLADYVVADLALTAATLGDGSNREVAEKNSVRLEALAAIRAHRDLDGGAR